MMRKSALSGDPDFTALDGRPHLLGQGRPPAVDLGLRPWLGDTLARAGDDRTGDGPRVDLPELQPGTIKQHIVRVLLGRIGEGRCAAVVAIDFERTAGFDFPIERQGAVDGDLLAPHTLEAPTLRGPRLQRCFRIERPPAASGGLCPTQQLAVRRELDLAIEIPMPTQRHAAFEVNLAAERRLRAALARDLDANPTPKPLRAWRNRNQGASG